MSSSIQRGSTLESADIKNHQANDHDFSVGDKTEEKEGGDLSLAYTELSQIYLLYLSGVCRR